jgi:hypothetical protein
LSDLPLFNALIGRPHHDDDIGAQALEVEERHSNAALAIDPFS